MSKISIYGIIISAARILAVTMLLSVAACGSLYAQNYSPLSYEKAFPHLNNYNPLEKNDRLPGNTVFNMKLLGAITANETSTAYYTYGYGISPSAQFKMGSVLTFFTELTVCRMKYIEKETTSSSSLTLSESMKLTFLISVGLKVYPFKKEAPFYGKAGLGLMSRVATKLYKNTISIPPALVMGFGYEIAVSKLFNVSPEFQTNIIGKTAEFSLGAGVIFQP